MPLESVFPKRRRRARRLLAAAALLLGCAALTWRWQATEQPTLAGAAAAAQPAPAADLPPANPGATASTAAAAPLPASAALDTSDVPAAHATASEAAKARHATLLAAIEQQWCSHYAEADAQYMQALAQSHPFDPKDPHGPALSRRAEATRALPTQQARMAVRNRIQDRWIAQLDQAGDAASLAIAAVLAQEAFHLDWAQRQARLAAAQQQALSTTDALVAAIWASGAIHCQGEVDCREGARRRWQAVEPANLAAWVPNRLDPPKDASWPWEAIAQAQYSRSATAAVQSRLLAMLPSAAPGLEQEVALGLIEGISGIRRDSIGRFQLLQSCRAAKTAESSRAACLHAAHLIWNEPHPSMLDRLQLLDLAEALGAQDEPVWAARGTAMKQELSPAMARSIFEVEFGQDVQRYPGCRGHAARQARLRQLVEGGLLRVLQHAAASADASPP
jgi:hypothetical protein